MINEYSFVQLSYSFDNVLNISWQSGKIDWHAILVFVIIAPTLLSPRSTRYHSHLEPISKSRKSLRISNSRCDRLPLTISLDY